MARRSLAGGATAGAASRVRFAPTSNNLLVSSWDSGLRLYDADTNTLRFKAESEPALLDCCFEDESAAFACCSDGSVRRYDFRSVSQDTVGLHDDAVSCVEYSQTAELFSAQIVTGSLDKKLQLWDTKIRNVTPTSMITFDSDVSSLSVCGMYISVAVARNVYFYDMRNLTGPVKAKFSPLEYHIRCLQSSSEWNGYVAGSVDGVVALNYLDDVTDRNLGYAFRCHPNSRNGRSNLVAINCITIHPCKKIFVTGDDGGYAIAWDGQSKKKLVELPSFSGSVASVAYNHSGQLLAVAPNYHHEADTICCGSGHAISLKISCGFSVPRKAVAPNSQRRPSQETCRQMPPAGRSDGDARPLHTVHVATKERSGRAALGRGGKPTARPRSHTAHAIPPDTSQRAAPHKGVACCARAEP
ncbi:hypothetical protein C2845_PM02G05840 [Panicum miliaceum]|uniref:Uncharacterized protein n=1 Tax=Panicum miliaceum TaxID=4540 RepID=A0A3L6S6C9_PANMI|nr:hypothetical protein C2845_PM02G05840 [Panicum miliaceum]